MLGGDTAVSGEGGQQEAVSKWKELDSRIGTEYPCMRHFKVSALVLSLALSCPHAFPFGSLHHAGPLLPRRAPCQPGCPYSSASAVPLSHVLPPTSAVLLPRRQSGRPMSRTRRW